MNKKRKKHIIIVTVVSTIVIIYHMMKQKSLKKLYKVDVGEPIGFRKIGFYEKYIKPIFDFFCAIGTIIVFSPLYIIIALLVRLKLGSPILFTQARPGLAKDGKETIFTIYKFRTMTNERDENDKLLPDEVRLTEFGQWLRKTSLDELPEVFNILNGTMSVVGPRPQLVRDMVFMTNEQRLRHTAKPGLSGLAQINGRNDINWEEKFNWDLKYIEEVSFLNDLRIIVKTIKKAFVTCEGVSKKNMATTEDFGDYLLNCGKIDRNTYIEKQKLAKMITKL